MKRMGMVLLTLLGLPALALHFLLCRLRAEPCPHCGQRWLTELVGEWDGEDWHCLRCGHYWVIPRGEE